MPRWEFEEAGEDYILRYGAMSGTISRREATTLFRRMSGRLGGQAANVGTQTTSSGTTTRGSLKRKVNKRSASRTSR